MQLFTWFKAKYLFQVTHGYYNPYGQVCDCILYAYLYPISEIFVGLVRIVILYDVCLLSSCVITSALEPVPKLDLSVGQTKYF